MEKNPQIVSAPWVPHRVMPNSRLITPEPACYITAGPINLPGNRVVAAIYHVEGFPAQDTSDLISAAPDLLSACRAAAILLVGEADHCIREGKRNAALNVRQVEKLIAEAIRKAAGGQPR